MASMEFIKKRIEGKEKELDKLEKKLVRIRKAEAGNWETNNPYYYNEHDLKWCLKDIEAAQKALEDYKAQLVAETEKANSRNVQIIIDFLEMWKAKVRKYYTKGLKDYYTDKEAVTTAYRNLSKKFQYGTPEYKEASASFEAIQKRFRIDCYGKYEKREFINRWGKPDSTEVKVAEGKYEYLNPYTNERTFEEATAKLEKDLIQEANRKYDFIIERTNAIVGTITDASNLKIGAKDDLNGFIIGTKGTAKVQTIGAGGYNIQCFHFRTLINKMK